jgi:prepilin-type N-terminal cleavage/methylation domain-containing protein
VRSNRHHARGFSLLELLVTVALSGITLASVVKFFAMQTRALKGHTYRVEAQQATRSSIDAITRDVRLAGACMPLTGAFVALAGTNGAGAASDSITVRSGVVRANMSCVRAGLTVVMNVGATTAQLDSTNGFAVGQLVYLSAPAGNGQFQTITAVGGTSITLNGGANAAYPVSSGLYAIDQRQYTVDAVSVPNRLNLTIDNGAPQAFAAGVTNLQVQYVLDQNCPPAGAACTVIDLPANAATWRLVNSVRLTVSVQTVGTTRPEDLVTLTQSGEVKPRNLLTN